MVTSPSPCGRVGEGSKNKNMRKLKVTEMGRITPQEFQAADKNPLVVVLDHVRSLYNVGSVFRTADAMRLAGICLCGITATPPNVEIHKTALGAEDTVEWKYFKQTEDAVEWLKEEGYTIMAVEQCEGSTMLQNFTPDPKKKYAIIMGNIGRLRSGVKPFWKESRKL